MDDNDLTPVGQRLTLRYVPLAQVTLWERNPKRHDLPGLMQSLRRYGFQDPPKFDQTLNEGRGGLVFGNGRITALQLMQAQGDPPPVGISLTPAGEWAAPILFGNDLASQQAAEAFAIDHNNLVMSGSDFTSVYMTAMWAETQYVTMLTELAPAALPLTVAETDLAVLEEVIMQETGRSGRPDRGAKIRLGLYRFYVPPEAYEPWAAALACQFGEDKAAIVAELKRRLGLPLITDAGETDAH